MSEPVREKCSFIPLKKGSEPCAIEVSVTFGEKKYCKAHSKTRQALQEKAKAESRELQKKAEEERIKQEELRLQEERLLAEKLKFEEEKKIVAEKLLAEQEERTKIAGIKTLPEFPFQERVVEIGPEIFLNRWGRYEDPKSNYVFERRKCYGRQLPNGEVVALSPKDILFLEKNRVPHIEEDSGDESSSEEEYPEEDEDENSEEEEEENSDEEDAGSEEEGDDSEEEPEDDDLDDEEAGSSEEGEE